MLLEEISEILKQPVSPHDLKQFDEKEPPQYKETVVKILTGELLSIFIQLKKARHEVHLKQACELRAQADALEHGTQESPEAIHLQKRHLALLKSRHQVFTDIFRHAVLEEYEIGPENYFLVRSGFQLVKGVRPKQNSENEAEAFIEKLMAPYKQ